MTNRFEAKDGIVVDNNTSLMWMQSPLERLFTWGEACTIKHSFGGFDDWRLPTIIELAGIVDYCECKPACNEVFRFEEEQIFWSSSPYVGYSSKAWSVDFDYGYVKLDGYRYNAFSVRLVRTIKELP